MMKRFMLPAVVLTFLSLPVLAAEEAAESTGQMVIEGVLPIIIVFSVAWFLVRRVSRRNEPYLERSNAHMARVEEQNEAIIQLLREIAEKRTTPERNPPRLPQAPAGPSDGRG